MQPVTKKSVNNSDVFIPNDTCEFIIAFWPRGTAGPLGLLIERVYEDILGGNEQKEKQRTRS